MSLCYCPSKFTTFVKLCHGVAQFWFKSEYWLTMMKPGSGAQKGPKVGNLMKQQKWELAHFSNWKVACLRNGNVSDSYSSCTFSNCYVNHFYLNSFCWPLTKFKSELHSHYHKYERRSCMSQQRLKKFGDFKCKLWCSSELAHLVFLEWAS